MKEAAPERRLVKILFIPCQVHTIADFNAPNCQYLPPCPRSPLSRSRRCGIIRPPPMGESNRRFFSRARVRGIHCSYFLNNALDLYRRPSFDFRIDSARCIVCGRGSPFCFPSQIALNSGVFCGFFRHSVDLIRVQALKVVHRFMFQRQGEE